MSQFYPHTLQFDSVKINGCMSCMRACPTQAIRVHGWHAVMLKDRCIDCGACGAPTCQAFAEDVVLNQAQESSCVFVREQRIAEMVGKLSSMIHPEDQEDRFLSKVRK